MLSLNICIVLDPEGTFECDEGGVGTSVGVGYESTDDLRDDFSRGTEVVDGAHQDQRWDSGGDITSARFEIHEGA